jgi:hypothetical protein
MEPTITIQPPKKQKPYSEDQEEGAQKEKAQEQLKEEEQRVAQQLAKSLQNNMLNNPYPMSTNDVATTAPLVANNSVNVGTDMGNTIMDIFNQFAAMPVVQALGTAYNVMEPVVGTVNRVAQVPFVQASGDVIMDGLGFVGDKLVQGKNAVANKLYDVTGPVRGAANSVGEVLGLNLMPRSELEALRLQTATLRNQREWPRNLPEVSSPINEPLTITEDDLLAQRERDQARPPAYVEPAPALPQPSKPTNDLPRRPNSDTITITEQDLRKLRERDRRAFALRQMDRVGDIRPIETLSPEEIATLAAEDERLSKQKQLDAELQRAINDPVFGPGKLQRMAVANQITSPSREQYGLMREELRQQAQNQRALLANDRSNEQFAERLKLDYQKLGLNRERAELLARKTEADVARTLAQVSQITTLTPLQKEEIASRVARNNAMAGLLENQGVRLEQLTPLEAQQLEAQIGQTLSNTRLLDRRAEVAGLRSGSSPAGAVMRDPTVQKLGENVARLEAAIARTNNPQQLRALNEQRDKLLEAQQRAQQRVLSMLGESNGQDMSLQPRSAGEGNTFPNEMARILEQLADFRISE